MFTSAGDKRGPILEAYLATSRFPDKAGTLDVAIHIQDKATGESDWWRGELSADYCQSGNRSGQRWADITLESLGKIGWQYGGNVSNQTLATLVGTEVSFTVKSRVDDKGQTRYDLKYLGASTFTPEKANDADAAARVAAIFGAPAQHPVQPAAPQYAPPPQPQWGAQQPQQPIMGQPVQHVPAGAVPVNPF